MMRERMTINCIRPHLIYFIACFLLIQDNLLYWDNLSKLVNLLTSALFIHSLHIVVLGLLLLSPVDALLSRLNSLKIAIRSYYHSAPVLWNNLPSDLRHVAHHVTPSPILKLACLLSFNLSFITKIRSASEGGGQSGGFAPQPHWRAKSPDHHNLLFYHEIVHEAHKKENKVITQDCK